ncbi:MAG: hypothetical protein JWN38_16 [Candidatus Saccharibacteria bacterium]|nr:hypothetical protein [Candidatus Saccharibacteria bacterium]
MARNIREDAGVCHHLDAGLDLLGEGLGEVLIGHGERVGDLLAVDVVDEAKPLRVPVELEVSLAVLDRVAGGVLLDLDLAGQVVDLLEVGHRLDGQVLQHDGVTAAADDRVAHAGRVEPGVAVELRRVAIREVADDRQAVVALGDRQRCLEGSPHRRSAPAGPDQLLHLQVVVLGDEDRVGRVAVGDDRDRARGAEVQRGAQVADQDLEDRRPLVLDGARVVDHDDDLGAEAGHAAVFERRLHGIEPLDEADVLGVVANLLAEADSRLLRLHVGEGHAAHQLLGRGRQTRRRHECRSVLDGHVARLLEESHGSDTFFC